MWLRALASALGIALVLSLALTTGPSQPASAQGPDDFSVPGGWFFSQANGKGGGGDVGYSVTNANGILFWDWFNAFGGVPQVGYPVSHRFIWKGFTVQAFQKVVFQWRPEIEQVYFVNVFDELSAVGLDGRLNEQRAIPQQLNWGNDAGLTWGEVVPRHLLVLSQHPAIEQAFYDSPDPVLFNGLPMGYEDFGNVFVVRAQRKVFQQWKIDVPWARAGQVVVANGGDIAKEYGLYPQAAIAPAAPGEGQSPVNPPGATATPNPATCRGDERLIVNPPNPMVGQPLYITVTSDRASANVGLTGPYNPILASITQTGPLTVWTWTATPTQPGRVDYVFTVENSHCATNFAEVVPPGATAAPVTATPPAATPVPATATPAAATATPSPATATAVPATATP